MSETDPDAIKRLKTSGPGLIWTHTQQIQRTRSDVHGGEQTGLQVRSETGVTVSREEVVLPWKDLSPMQQRANARRGPLAEERPRHWSRLSLCEHDEPLLEGAERGASPATNAPR